MRAITGCHLKHFGIYEPPAALKHLHAGLAQKNAHATDQLPDDALFAGLHGRPVRSGAALQPYAKCFCVLNGTEHLSAAQERLGGNTAYIQADAADLLLLDYGCLSTQLGCAQRGDVPARSRAENCEFGLYGHQHLPPGMVFGF